MYFRWLQSIWVNIKNMQMIINYVDVRQIITRNSKGFIPNILHIDGYYQTSRVGSRALTNDI